MRIAPLPLPVRGVLSVRQQLLGVWAGAAVAVLLGWWFAAQYLPFVADDALISLRYADRFVDGRGLTWTDGERVEGYSNLLWILLCALLHTLGVDLIDATRVLGATCLAASVAALAFLASVPAKKGASLRSPAAPVLGGLLIASSGPWAVWVVGGLEAVLQATTLLWGAVLSVALFEERRPTTWRLLAAGIPLALLCLTRPDGPLFAGVIGMGVALARRTAWKEGVRRAVLLGVPAMVAVVGHTAFRVASYGDWVPNTAHIKAKFGERTVEGLSYLASGAGPLGFALAFGALGVVAAWFGHRRGPALTVAAAVVGWLAYVALIGGDIFPAFRPLVPGVALLALLGMWGVEWLLAHVKLPRRAVLCGLFAVPALSIAVSSSHVEVRRGEQERWEWDGAVTGPVLARAFGDEDPLIAVTAAGTLPYFSKLRAHDMAGLNDRHIALQPPVAGPLIGHDHADGKYTLDLEPDLIVFGGARGGEPRLLPGDQIKRDSRFRRDYRKATLEGYDPYLSSTTAFVRLDGKLGVQSGPDRVSIPGWLLGGAVGQLAKDAVVGRLPAGKARRSPRVRLSAGTWTARFEPTADGVELSVVPDRGSRVKVVTGANGGPTRLVVPAAGLFRFDATAQGVDAFVGAVVLERTAVPAAVTGAGVTDRPRPVLVGKRPSPGAKVDLRTPDRRRHAFKVQPGAYARIQVKGRATARLRHGDVVLWTDERKPEKGDHVELDLGPWVGEELVFERYRRVEQSAPGQARFVSLLR